MNLGLVEASGLVFAPGGAALARRCAPAMLAVAAGAGLVLVLLPA